MKPSDVEHELSQGYVSQIAMQHFREAFDYGTAPSLQWLTSQLVKLRVIITLGNEITVEKQDTKLILSGMNQFIKWRNEHFPNV